MLASTSKFTLVNVIHDREGFALATGYWDGDHSILRLACRWHEDGGLGYPQTFGKPQWMMFPETVKVEQVVTLIDGTTTTTKKVVATF